MADQQPASVQAHVRAQFDRQVAHYLHGSAMADQELEEAGVPIRGGPLTGQVGFTPRPWTWLAATEPTASILTWLAADPLPGSPTPR